MELQNKKATDAIIGHANDDKGFIIRCCCNAKPVTYFFSKKVCGGWNLLKNLIEDYPDVILFKQELTPEELHSIEPTPTIIMDISPRYKIVAYNNQYNIFKKYGEYVITNYFIHPCNKSIDENMTYNSYNTITEAIKMLTRFSKTKITCFGSNLNVGEWNEVTRNFNIHIKQEEVTSDGK